MNIFLRQLKMEIALASINEKYNWNNQAGQWNKIFIMYHVTSKYDTLLVGLMLG